MPSLMQSEAAACFMCKYIRLLIGLIQTCAQRRYKMGSQVCLALLHKLRIRPKRISNAATEVLLLDKVKPKHTSEAAGCQLPIRQACPSWHQLETSSLGHQAFP